MINKSAQRKAWKNQACLGKTLVQGPMATLKNEKLNLPGFKGQDVWQLDLQTEPQPWPPEREKRQRGETGYFLKIS